MATIRNTRNYNVEVENTVERRLNKAYNPGRPITLAEQLEAERVRKAQAAKAKAEAQVAKEKAERKWFETANSGQRITSRMVNFSHGRFDVTK